MSTALVFKDYGGPETQELVEREAPSPGRGEVAIAVKAAGVNPADWKIRAGQLGDHWKLPASMGREASGVVTAVGEDVENFSVGDAVLGLAANGHGTFAEYTLLDAAKTVAKPQEISFADAAVIPVAGATAYDLTHQIKLERGQTMLILGVGGVGLMAAQIGKVHEFTVIGVASASKKGLVESTGATFIESGDGAPDRARQVAPDGVDLVVDLVGGQPLRDIAVVAKDPATIISAADPITAEALGGSGVTRTNEGLAKITDVIQYGLVDPHVSQRFSLTNAQDAVAAVETGHTAGKVIIEP